MKINAFAVATLAAACGLATSARADALSWDPSWAYSGFGTFGYVQTDTDAGLYNGQGQQNGASKDGTLGVDSKLGLQVNAKANNVFSATVQAISERNGNGNFKPAIEWAFVKAQATPGLSLRAGRIGAPLFMVSDYRSIGYANTWVRTPPDVYGQVSFSHVDGADAIYQDTVGPATLTAQAFYGKSDSIYRAIPIHVKNEAGLNVVAEFDDGFTVRVGRVQGKLTVDRADVDSLVAILQATPFAAVGDEIDPNSKDASFTGIGVGYDHENWIANLEYTKRKTSSFVSSTTGWAGTLGYRVGKFTPYAVVSQLKVDNTNVDNTIPAATQQLAALSELVDEVVASQDVTERTNSLGVRWDAWKNIDVKAQWDRIRPASGGVGLFNNVTSPLPSTVNVYSVAVDFVF